MKNIPKRDGSGRGIRANRGRGGCKVTKTIGQGKASLSKGKIRRPGVMKVQDKIVLNEKLDL